jgi:magnesium chelatase family protein
MKDLLEVPKSDSGSCEEERELVLKTRSIQAVRQGRLNAHASMKELRKYLPRDTRLEKLLEDASKKNGLSARGLTRVLRVARTIADLADARSIEFDHLAEALHFRELDRLHKMADGVVS